MIDKHYLRSEIKFKAAFYVHMVSLKTDMCQPEYTPHLALLLVRLQYVDLCHLTTPISLSVVNMLINILLITSQMFLFVLGTSICKLRSL